MIALPEYALTMLAPWWAFVVHEDKDVENRPKGVATFVRRLLANGPLRVLITTSKGHITRGGTRFSTLSTSAGIRPLVGHDIKAICRDAPRERRADAPQLTLRTFMQGAGHAVGTALIVGVRPPSPQQRGWQQPGMHGLVLINPEPIEPLPVIGGQGLWRVTTCAVCNHIMAAGARHECAVGPTPALTPMEAAPGQLDLFELARAR